MGTKTTVDEHGSFSHGEGRMKRWWRKLKQQLLSPLLDWYLERERLRQIRRREELGDL
jgi:hypothetical protein